MSFIRTVLHPGLTFHTSTDLRGLYVLKNDNKPVYVGISSNYVTRLSSHFSGEKAGKFDSYTFYPATNVCTDFDLRVAEAMLIEAYDPALNQHKNKSVLHPDKLIGSRNYMNAHGDKLTEVLFQTTTSP